MKYLLNWIEKELNPERHVSSKTTSSEYYYFYGAKVRFADHISDRNDSDLEIILVKDLPGQNKHYLIYGILRFSTMLLEYFLFSNLTHMPFCINIVHLYHQNTNPLTD